MMGAPIPKLGVLTYGFEFSGGYRILLRGANFQSLSAYLFFASFYAENCMKMKEFGSQKALAPDAPNLGSASEISTYIWI